MASEIHKDDVGTRFLLTVKDGSDVVNIYLYVHIRHKLIYSHPLYNIYRHS